MPTDQTQPSDREAVTRTGKRVPELVADAEADWGHVTKLLGDARDFLRAMETEARGVNGMAATARGIAQTLDSSLEVIAKEGAELRKKMLGGGMVEQITQRVDHEHAGRVKAAKEAA